MAEEEKSSGGFWDSLLTFGGGFVAYDLRKEELEQQQLQTQYGILELQAEQSRMADVASSGLSFLQTNKSMIIIAGALLFSGLMIYKVTR